MIELGDSGHESGGNDLPKPRGMDACVFFVLVSGGTILARRRSSRSRQFILVIDELFVVVCAHSKSRKAG